MENNNNEIKSLLVIATAAVIVLCMIVGGITYVNNKNRDFEHKMASEGYELRPVVGHTGVYWQKVQGDK